MENHIENKGEAEDFLEKWKKDLKAIEQDLSGLFIVRSAFEKLRKVVLAVKDISPKDEAFVSSFKVFADLVLQGYVAFIVMGIRRHMKPNKDERKFKYERRFKSISLVGLLEGISKHPEYISKSYFISLYHCEDIEPEGSMVNEEDLSDEEKKAIDDRAKVKARKICKEGAEGKWKKLSGDCEFLPPEVVEKDIKELKECVEDIEDFADKYIAHLDRKRKPSKLTLNKIANSLSKIEELYKKCSELLTGSFPSSLEPVSQFSDKKFFDEFEKWLVKKFSKETTE